MNRSGTDTLAEEPLWHLISELTFARFIATFQAGEKGLHLPPYKGSLFRGVIGHAFRQFTCTCPREPGETVRVHLEDCIYQYLFETKSGVDRKSLQGSEEAQRPFLILPPLEEKEIYHPGERFSLTFTLFGHGIDYLPYFVLVLDRIGEIGLGRGRGKAFLRQIFFEDLDGDLHPIYHAKEKRLQTTYEIYRGSSFAGEIPRGDRLTIQYVTPLRMKEKEHFLITPEFRTVLRGAIRRILSLTLTHQPGQKAIPDYRGFLSRADEVTLIGNETRWFDWERYSNRQQERMKLGGIVGEATYSGPWQIYYPILKIAEWTHVGKSTVFGLGKILAYAGSGD